MNLRKLTAGLMLTSLFAASSSADDFGAMPGLWNITVRNESDAGTAQARPDAHWRCVDEGANPWTAFAETRVPAGYSCKRTAYERTATSLKWHLDCKGASAISSEGSIVFDSAKHYTGEVELKRVKNKDSQATKTTVEGTRVAACTSPQD